MSSGEDVAADKARLREALNQAHALRLQIKQTPQTPNIQDVTKLQDLATRCLQLSTKLEMEHGRALALEMQASAALLEFDTRGATPVEPAEYEAVEKNLLDAEKIALAYQDLNLETRIIETLANIFRRSDQYEKEIAAIKKAIAISRTVPKTVALLDAYHRILNYLYDHQPTNTDAIVKFNTDYWGNYLWLKEHPGVWSRDQFILQKKIMLYKVAIYIGSLAGNPLHVGEQNSDDAKLAHEAYDEAIYIGEVLKNTEFICAAHAHKALMLAPRLNINEKRGLLRNLEGLEEAYHPENGELREMIDMLDKQLNTHTPTPPPQHETGR